jgi:hypothetical protein
MSFTRRTFSRARRTCGWTFTAPPSCLAVVVYHTSHFMEQLADGLGAISAHGISHQRSCQGITLERESACYSALVSLNFVWCKALAADHKGNPGDLELVIGVRNEGNYQVHKMIQSPTDGR